MIKDGAQVFEVLFPIEGDRYGCRPEVGGVVSVEFLGIKDRDLVGERVLARVVRPDSYVAAGCDILGDDSD